MSFGDSLPQIEKNNSKIISLEKIENLSIFRAALALENMKNIKSHFDHCNLKITLCNALISMFIWIHYRTFHIRSFECLLCALPLVIVRDLFEAIAVVGTTFRYDLSLPPREPRRVGVVAVSLKISELFSICMITQPWLKYIGRHYVLLGSRFFWTLDTPSHFIRISSTVRSQNRANFDPPSPLVRR